MSYDEWIAVIAAALALYFGGRAAERAADKGWRAMLASSARASLSIILLWLAGSIVVALTYWAGSIQLPQPKSLAHVPGLAPADELGEDADLLERPPKGFEDLFEKPVPLDK